MKRLGLATCSLILAAVSGCGSPNAGEQKIEDFERWLAQHPVDGLSVETARAQNALPWVGNGDVTVLVAPPADLPSAAEHLCGYDEVTVSAVSFTVHVGKVVTPLACPAADVSGLAATVTELDAVRGLAHAELHPDGGLDLAFRSRRALVAGYPDLADDPAYAGVDAHTEGLLVVDDVHASDELREAFRVQLDRLSPLVTRIAVQPRSGSRPEQIAVDVIARPRRVRREMVALTPTADVTVTELP